MSAAESFRRVARLAARLASLAALPAIAESGGGLAPPSCDYGEAHPSAPTEFAEFGFLIGDFTISLHAWRNGAWTPPRPGAPARWNGRYGLGGMAIIDEWYDPDPGVDAQAPRGINVRMYDVEAGQWDMMWLATGSMQVQELAAAVEDGVLTMWQIHPERPDFRAIFHVHDEDRWERVQYARDDDGDWQPRFRLSAQRIACD